MTAEKKIAIEYKRTEAGLLPLDWEVVQLGSLVKITSGASPSLFSFSGSGIPYFKVEQLNNAEKYLDAFDTPYLFKRGDTVPRLSVVFAKRGAAIALNKIRILKEASFMDTNLMALTPQGGIECEYLYYALDHIGLWKFADTTSVPQINNKHINPIAFPLPPLAEQRDIAKALSDVDTLLDRLSRLIEKKRAIKKGAMQELLTGRRRIADFSGKWETKKLSEIGKTYGGLSGKVKADFGRGDSSYIPFMNIMNNPVIDPGYLEIVNIQSGENQNRAHKGDLFFNGSSETPEEVGMCSVLLVEVPNLYLNSFCFGLRLNKKLKTNGLFFSYYFRSDAGRELIFSLAQGATRYNLSKTKFLELKVPYPKPEEQVAVANVLFDMDSEIRKLESQLMKYQDIKQGMMQKLLTGKIRLI